MYKKIDDQAIESISKFIADLTSRYTLFKLYEAIKKTQSGDVLENLKNIIKDPLSFSEFRRMEIQLEDLDFDFICHDSYSHFCKIFMLEYDLEYLKGYLYIHNLSLKDFDLDDRNTIKNALYMSYEDELSRVL